MPTQHEMQRVMKLLEAQGEVILKEVLMQLVSEQQILEELWSDFLRCDETL